MHQTNQRTKSLALAGLLLAGCAETVMTGPPESKREPVTDTWHGTDVVDPYRWLEDQESPETRAWIDAQMAYTRSVLDDLPGRAAIEETIAKARRVTEWSVPFGRQGRYFFTRKAPDAQLAVIVMREGLEGEERVLVDPHTLSPDQTISASIAKVSASGRLLLYQLREGGEDEVVVRLYGVDQNRVLEEFPKARYGGMWITPDETGMYFARWTKTGPRIYRHEFGTPPEEDPVVFGEDLGMDRWLEVAGSAGGRYLLYTVAHGWDKSELFLADSEAGSPPALITGGADAVFKARFAGERLVIGTDWQAPNRRVMIADPAQPGITQWKELIPQWEYPIELDELTVAGGRIVLHRLRRAVSTLDIHSIDGKLIQSAELDGPVSVHSPEGAWEEPDLFFKTETFTDPGTIHHIDLERMNQAIWAESGSTLVEGLSIVSTQVSYRSKDGTEIPMFLVHREGIEPNGANPALLYGYGGFNASLIPAFNAVRASWVASGGILAIPNLRGGGEFGETWHQAGMLDNKQNVFDDFIAAAEWLIENRYTNPRKLAILGGSNGGLLVGAAMTQRPELFEAVVCTYPLLDMLRYHKFLLGPLWVAEYGSAEDPEQFEYLRAYSPYHNVKQGAEYPAVLFKTGDGDTRVAPLHARKMAALVQWATASDNPVLLHYDTKFGHSAGMPVDALIASDADVLQFLMWRLEMLEN